MNVLSKAILIYFMFNNFFFVIHRFGRVEKVKILPKKSPDGGLAAFVDFVDIRSATKANETTNYIGDRELRTNYNEPGNHPAVLGEGRGRGWPHMYDRG